MLFIYLGLFLWVAIIRGPRLFGHHLQSLSEHKNWLRRNLYVYFLSNSKFRELYAVHIGVEARQQLLPFVVRKERFYHRYFKRIGMAYEIFISDADFDKKYYITTDAPHHLEALMNAGMLLESLKGLMAKQVSSVHVAGHRTWCVLADADQEKTTTELAEHYQILEQIAKATTAHSLQRKQQYLPVVAASFLVVHLSIILCSIASIFPQLDSPDTIDYAQLFGLGCLVGILAIFIWHTIIIAIFKKSSWLGWVMADFWIFGAFGMLLGGITLSHQLNQAWVQPAPMLKVQQVNRKECTLFCHRKCGRRCTETKNFKYAGDAACEPQQRTLNYNHAQLTNEICQANARFEYEILASSWRQGLKSDMVYRTEVRPDVFDQLKEGGQVIIPVNSGALGFEWVDYQAILPY